MTIDPAAVQNLISAWWFNYDEANFDKWPELLADDVHFTCRTDTGQTDYEEFVRADHTGKDAVLAWQRDHREHSPYPLRHNATNIHIVEQSGDEATFASYIFVTQIAGGVSNLSSAPVTGRVRMENGALRIAELNVVLDTAESKPLLSG